MLGELDSIGFEIIVVDNCSTDSSAVIAKDRGASVFFSRANTVAGVRNEGVSHSRGDIIAFVDADVIITGQWLDEIDKVYAEIENNELLITGSHCGVPDSLIGPLGHWYREIAKDSRNTHLGSGHMLIHRKLFTALGGFSNELKTGEDYEFCERAKSIGAVIKHNSNLRVVHLGFPDSFLGFLKRECWHGLGDVQKVSGIIKSKVAFVSLVFLVLHILLVIALFSEQIIAGLVIFFTILSLLWATIIYKFKVLKLKKLILLTPAAYLYLAGRSMALFRCCNWSS
tara:strand:+ start:21786 stop:22637 length:852 start_codon:yes stop_codon:yes gene_type:complete